MPSFEKGKSDAPKKVLIAGVSSEFKDAVIKKVIEKLGTDSYYFKGIGLSQFEKEDLTGYDAVLVVCMYSAGKIDVRVCEYFAKDPTDGKLIALYTVGAETDDRKKPDWAIPKVTIDAVSSASTMNKVEKLAEELALLIKKLCE